jgi:Rad3-related DNA helicase
MSADERITGAVMMGVCRGKLSEGIDFSDEAARCVVVFGIPYPNYADVKVVVKRQYLDERNKREGGKMVNG